jgi:outer membrane lipoprotein SlyB
MGRIPTRTYGSITRVRRVGPDSAGAGAVSGPVSAAGAGAVSGPVSAAGAGAVSGPVSAAGAGAVSGPVSAAGAAPARVHAPPALPFRARR